MGPLRIPFTVVRRVGEAGLAAVRAVLDRGPADQDRFAEDPAVSVPAPPSPTHGFEPSPRRPVPPAPAAPAPAARPSAPPVEPPPPSRAWAPDAPGAGGLARDLPAEESELVAEVGDPADVGPSVHVEGEPFGGYDNLRAQEIVARLRDADQSTRARVRLYEQAHKQRKTIIEAARR